VIRRFLARLNVVPFEEMMAEFILLSGAFGLVGIGGASQDALTMAIGDWALVFQASYVLAGLGMLIGMGTSKANIEAAGLALLLVSVLVRLIVFLYLFGLNEQAWVSLIFYLVITRACVRRMHTLVQGEAIWKVNGSAEEIR
jgi:hypothetical protein